MTEWVRAGGGGGGHGGGGGGGHGGGGGYSSGGSSHSYSGGSYSGGNSYSTGDGDGSMGFGTFVFVVFVFVIIYVVKSRLDKLSNSREGLGEAELAIMGLNRSLTQNGSVEPVSAELYAKVETAFRTVQQSWSQKRIDLMRRFISDGAYQRFNAQFTMMGLLGQTNPISNVVVHRIEQVKQASPTQGAYDSIDIRIEASADDQFISTMHPELNSPGGNERFVEYWSFIRRKDYEAGKDIYHANTCPKCSAPLDQKMMQDARCHYCGTYINNGEFDWVLAEITQEENYSGTGDVVIPTEVLRLAPTTSVQILEDKASNAFTQILIARATGDAKALGRFCSTEVAAKLSRGTEPRIYDRLYLNSVDAKSVTLAQGLISASIQIVYTYHDMGDGGDGTEMTRAEAQLLLVHKPTGAEAKGTIYANACATCGAPQKDSISHTCAYCGAVLSDVTREWIVGGIDEV